MSHEEEYEEFSKVKERKIKDLYTECTRKMSYTINELIKEPKKRLRRYQGMKIITVSLMMISMVLMVYLNGVGEVDRAILRGVSILLSFSVLFYIIDAFLRDYEVGLQSSLFADNLSKILRRKEFEWTVADDIAQKIKIVEELSTVELSDKSIPGAQRALETC